MYEDCIEAPPAPSRLFRGEHADEREEDSQQTIEDENDKKKYNGVPKAVNFEVALLRGVLANRHAEASEGNKENENPPANAQDQGRGLCRHETNDVKE